MARKTTMDRQAGPGNNDDDVMGHWLIMFPRSGFMQATDCSIVSNVPQTKKSAASSEKNWWNKS